MVTLIGASALTLSPNCWIPLKGLYLRNVLLLSLREDSGYIACQELQTGAKTEAVWLVASVISPLNTQQKKLKKRRDTFGVMLCSSVGSWDVG